ncbi:phage holin family protein [Candidatus Daviesbacteria bacterium]|nr:phage holin family protein [Candidatus Daviesbacteria bacterium]
MNILISLLLNAAALIVTAYIVPGFQVSDFTSAILAAIVLGVINTFIKPVLLVLTAPINLLTLGLFTFVVNAVVLWLVTLVVPGMTIDGFLPAILGAIVLSVVSTALSSLLKDFGKKSR